MSEPSKYVTVPGRIPGTAMNLGGVDLIIPPLNLDGIQVVTPLLEEFDKIKEAKEGLEMAARIVLVALHRNYPDMTLDDLLKLIDMGNGRRAVMAVTGISGFEVTKPGELRPATQ